MERPFFKQVLLSQDLHRSLVRVDSFVQRSVFKVLIGRSGPEVLDLARRETPDAIMAHYDLDRLKADEVCRVLKRPGSSLRTVPFLVVGPAGQPEIGESCRRAGCDEFIVAPSNPLVLSQKLASALGVQFRLQSRIPAVLSISFGRITSEFLGYSKDISEGGVLVESAVPIRAGKQLHLRLFMEGGDRPLVTNARVLRSEPSPEEDQFFLGMQFQSMDPGSASRLRDYIRARTFGV